MKTKILIAEYKDQHVYISSNFTEKERDKYMYFFRGLPWYNAIEESKAKKIEGTSDWFIDDDFDVITEIDVNGNMSTQTCEGEK